uniref:Uncharacterized protein n=1 Tax=Panagrolaimus sp. ES5 TaxID=591445 RepID=A0AC34G338_9BILA
MKLLFAFTVLAIFALAFAQQEPVQDAVDGQPEVLEIEEDTAPRFKRQFGYGPFGGYSGYGRGYGYPGYGGYGGGYGGGFGRPRTVIIKKVIIRGGGPMYG